MTTTAAAVIWLRPEYKGREDELIHLSAAATLVGVTRSTVSNWAKRHADFPKIALLMGIGAGRAKHVPRNEFLDFACTQLNKELGAARKTGPHRPSAVIRSEQIAHHERQIARLRDRADRHGPWSAVRMSVRLSPWDTLRPVRSGSRKAIPLSAVKEAVAAMKAEGKKVSGRSLARQLGCSERSGYRYLGQVQLT
jgi:hypothetical protein